MPTSAAQQVFGGMGHWFRLSRRRGQRFGSDDTPSPADCDAASGNITLSVALMAVALVTLIGCSTYAVTIHLGRSKAPIAASSGQSDRFSEEDASRLRFGLDKALGDKGFGHFDPAPAGYNATADYRPLGTYATQGESALSGREPSRVVVSLSERTDQSEIRITIVDLDHGAETREMSRIREAAIDVVTDTFPGRRMDVEVRTPRRDFFAP